MQATRPALSAATGASEVTLRTRRGEQLFDHDMGRSRTACV